MSSEDRAQLRVRMHQLRRALPADEVRSLSRQVIERFILGARIPPHFWNGKLVALYRSFPGELDLRTLEEPLLTLGARLCFPRILDSAAGLMDFAALSRESPFGGDPALGAHGIQEPPTHLDAVDPHDIDVIFLPGVAFGLQGERLGMGKGFYDRFLPTAPRAQRVALAFDFQLLPALEQSPWDQKVHWIWTEKRDVRLRSWP